MDVALDATGLAVRKYTPRWLTTDYALRGRDFVKLHAAIELDSQAFLSWELTYSNTHEVTLGPTLLEKITGKIARVFADAGYLSNKMCLAVHARGATPFIRPKKTSKGRERAEAYTPSQRVHEAYITMMDGYQKDEAAWLAIYHKRSGIESCFGGFKQRLRGSLRAMKERTMAIELVLKIIVWNVTRVTRL